MTRFCRVLACDVVYGDLSDVTYLGIVIRVWVLKCLYGAVTRSERYSVCHVVVLCFQVYEILLYKGANWGSIILRDRSVTSYTAI